MFLTRRTIWVGFGSRGFSEYWAMKAESLHIRSPPAWAVPALESGNRVACEINEA